jgi:glycosyltransferase involved in cell wall biosynthesis
MHDLIIERYPEQFNPIDVKTYRFKYKYACNYAGKIIAVSKQTKQDLIDFYKVPEAKIEVCYPASMPLFDKRVSEAEKQQIKALYKLPDRFFLSVGSIIPRKNLLTVCKAFYELKNSINIPLVVIGKGGKYKEEVKKYVADKSLHNRIIFLNDEPNVQSLQGFKSGEDFPAIYQQALCMIYPSRFEGFGLPVLEALQSGLPVITSNVSCLPETGGNAALYVHPLSVTELANAIATIAANEQLRRDMITRGYQHAQFFSQERCAANVMQLYESLL